LCLVDKSVVVSHYFAFIGSRLVNCKVFSIVWLCFLPWRKKKEKDVFMAGEVNMAIFCSYVGLDLQLCLIERGGGFEGLCLLCQLSNRCWRIGLLVLSLLKWMAVCLVRESRYRPREGIDASSSNA